MISRDRGQLIKPVRFFLGMWLLIIITHIRQCGTHARRLSIRAVGNLYIIYLVEQLFELRRKCIRIHAQTMAAYWPRLNWAITNRISKRVCKNWAMNVTTKRITRHSAFFLQANRGLTGDDLTGLSPVFL